jgi:GDPmannose 4,6-dehydratase
LTSKVLITGISGFVGPYLARQLIDAGHEVSGFVSRRANHLKPKRIVEMNLLPSVQFIEGDITDLTSFLFALQKAEPQWIFHLASQSYVLESFRDPHGTFRIICLGTIYVLEAVRFQSEEYGLRFKDRAHYESIKAKYGTVEPQPDKFPELPISEDGLMRPMRPYATIKVYGVFAFKNYHTTYGLETIVSRAFNHEGAGRGQYFVSSTIVRGLFPCI